MVKIEFTPLSLDRKIFPFKKGFKKTLLVFDFKHFQFTIFFKTHFPRVDIHRKDNAHSLKKEITVFGSSEACALAIRMILNIMQDERVTLSRVNIPALFYPN